VPRLTALLAEGERAYDFWQETRSREWVRPLPARQPAPAEVRQQAEQFWGEFRGRFPLVFDYLGDLAGTEDWVNGLAGHLDLVDPSRERKHEPSASLAQRGSELHLQLNGIWHFSDLRLLERFCEEELGAVATGNVSEEDFDEAAFGDPHFDPFAHIRL
jgi:hypothetical protein